MIRQRHKWAVFLVVAGIGMGSAHQLPYTAVQVVLDDKDLTTGNAVMLFAWLIGGAVSVAIGQNICLSAVRSLLPQYTNQISPSTAIAVGVYNLQSIAPSPAALIALQTVWNIGIDRALTFSLAAICIAVPVTACMEWKNSRRAAEKKIEKQSELKGEAGDASGNR